MKASRDSVEPYVWGEVSLGWRLLDEPDLAVVEELLPVGAGEQWHLHRTARQFFYVLNGAAVMSTPDAEIRLGPGEGCSIPPGQPHRIMNAADVATKFLVISAPGTRDDRVMIDEPVV